MQHSFAIATVAEHMLAGVAKHDLSFALTVSQCPIQHGVGSVSHTLCIWAGAVGLWRRLVHEMQSHKAVVLVFHIYPFFTPLQGTIGSLKDRQQEAVLLGYQRIGMALHVAVESVAEGLKTWQSTKHMTERTCKTARQGAHEHIHILDKQRFSGQASRVQAEHQRSKVDK